jgi:hypothetical protein
LWGSPCSNNVPGSLIIGLEREQWIQTNPLHSSRDSHTHVLLNSIVVQRWAIASPPTQELLFGRPGGIVDKGHEYYNDWTHVIHRRASHCLLKARQPEVVSAVILQASFLPHILTFIADPLTPSIQSFSLSVMPQRSCVVIVESRAAIEFTHAGPISPLRRWPTPKLVFIGRQTA